MQHLKNYKFLEKFFYKIYQYKLILLRNLILLLTQQAVTLFYKNDELIFFYHLIKNYKYFF